MRNLLLYIALCLAVLPLASHAQPRDFIERQKEVMRQLEERRIFPDSITREMGQVKIEVRAFPKDARRTRGSAFYEGATKTIYLNQEADFSGDSTVLVIHETLGAAGWRDVNYEYSSTAAELLHDLKAQNLSPTLRKLYREQLRGIPRESKRDYVIGESGKIDELNQRLAVNTEGGGVVLVGGGGDAKVARIKMGIAKKFNEKWRDNPAYQRKMFSSFLSGLKIESASGTLYKRKVRVKSTLAREKGYYERIFYVPTEMSPEQAVKDIWFFISFLGTRGSGTPGSILHLYIPRDPAEVRQFRDHPEDFIPRGP